MNKQLFRLKLLSALLLVTSLAKAQVNKIMGQVTDSSSKAPLPGAVVTVKETSESIVTDANGRFVMYIVSGNKIFTLFVTYVGYARERRTVLENADEQHIELKPEVILRQEIVIPAFRIAEPSVIHRFPSSASAGFYKNTPEFPISTHLGTSNA